MARVAVAGLRVAVAGFETQFTTLAHVFAVSKRVMEATTRGKGLLGGTGTDQASWDQVCGCAIMSTDVMDNPNSNTSQIHMSTFCGDENDTRNDMANFVASIPLPSDDDVQSDSGIDPYCQFCPDCNVMLKPQYFLKESHCQASEIPPSGHMAPPQDWKCCNPHCSVQDEFSTRCNQCFPPKLLRWVRDHKKAKGEHWILQCDDCMLAGRRGRKNSRKGAMCGRCIYCKVGNAGGGARGEGLRFSDCASC